MPATDDPPIPFRKGLHHVAEGHAPPNFCIAAANTVAHLHETTSCGHILVFAPGSAEIITICAMIRSVAKGLEVHPLFSAMPSESQNEALSMDTTRKCVVATSIAADAPMRNNVRYVVDTGVCKKKVYNPRLNMHMLETRLISQSLASERKGIATNLGRGVCIRLYSESAYHIMRQTTNCHKPIESFHVTVLKLLTCGKTNLAGHSWEDSPPSPDTLARVLQVFLAWGLVDDDAIVTELGKSVNQVAGWCVDSHTYLEPIWGIAIYEAANLGCMDEVIAIAALCSIQKSIFQEQAGMEKIASISRAKFAYGPSDHLAMLNAYSQYRQLVDRDEPENVQRVWCKLHFLNLNALNEAHELCATISERVYGLWRDEGSSATEDASVAEYSTSETEQSIIEAEDDAAEKAESDVGRNRLVTGNRYAVLQDENGMEAKANGLNHVKTYTPKDANILKAITRAFCTQIAIHEGHGDRYCTVDTNVSALLHSSCALVGLQPQWVVYTELSRRSRKQFLDTVSVVDVDWLLDLKKFQPDALALSGDGSIRQPSVKAALDAARAKTVAMLTVGAL